MARLHSYGTRHKPFYYPDASHPNDPAGWKVYRHASHPTGAHHDFQVKACVGARESFNFRIDYENLTPEEFTLLHFALTLRHQCERHSPEIRLLHKLGYGKGLGLGSCHIEIDRVEPENVKRYFPNQPGPPVPQPDSSLEPYLATPAFAAMAKLLAQGSSQELEYPGEWWFADAKLKPLSIAEYEAEANRRKPPAVSPPLPPPEGEPHADLPKRVQVRITRLDAGGIRGETLQAYEGHKYTCRARGRPYGREKGDECMVEVDRASVDHSKHFFEGKAIA
jgi:hypothetical protein